MTVVLPPEVFDAILDWVPAPEWDREAWDPKAAGVDILVCAMVCRAWLPRARHLAFSSIRYRCSYDEHPSQDPLAAILAHPLCTFRDHVRDFHLIGHGADHYCGLSWSCVPLLQQLTRLRLEDQWVGGHRDFDCLMAPPFGEKIDTLEMYHCGFSLPGQLLPLISRCRRLRSLALRQLLLPGWYDEYPVTEAPLDCAVPAGLEELVISYDIPMTSMSTLLRWFSPSSVGVTRIHRLDLVTIFSKTAPDSAHLVHLAELSLSSLALGFINSSDSSDAADAFCAATDFSTLTRLEVIEFRIYGLKRSRTDRHLQVQHIPSVLRSLRSEKTRIVRLYLNFMTEPEDLLVLDFEAIAASLSRDNYRNLEQFVVSPFQDSILSDSSRMQRLLDELLGSRLKGTLQTVCSP
ncbi:hypothetical protein AURDEDRAFT_174946 [Auricularia subglabra TFB-10046 SS5]|uniref:F-box domain-containing protein n=1 Tax=Auricularia subglabra (strain TFB-10046 / SS5) TaxID=717982 RepID=J0WTQ0_AURST|nr:hypothetical protein AURDEDRAFT_174946 [Auricularia subglabra TFB-10046 SS5]